MTVQTGLRHFLKGGWSALWALSSLEALAALVYLASLPSDAENSRLLGFSTARLALFGLLLALAGGMGALSVLARRPAWQKRGWAARKPFLVALPVVTLLSVLVPVTLYSLYRTGGDFRYFAYFQRLLPLFVWSGLVSLQTGIYLARRAGLAWGAVAQAQGAVFRAGRRAWAGLGLVAAFVALTGIGLRADVIGWGRPTVALLEWHLWLAWGSASLFLLLLARYGWRARNDWFLAGAIWLLAAGIWLSQPVPPSFFATAGRLPNQEIYPFSDGAYYGSFAQSVLIGNGFKGDEVPPRPLYITLLAGFHLIAGQSYEQVIAMQTLLLAFFPVVLFFLGKELHSRPAGLLLALLAILRELGAIMATAFTDNASNSKLFFADLPSALAIALLALLAVRWLRAPGRGGLRPFLVGGGLGLAMLFRTQSVFMLPGLLLLALLAGRLRWRAWIVSAAWLLLGLTLALVPWLARNTLLTGQLAFDDPKSQTGVMAQRYSLSGQDDQYIIRPGEDVRDFTARVNRGIFTFLTTHPGVVAQFMTGHLLNAEIANLLVLPVRDGLSEPGELLAHQTAFWEQWPRVLRPGQVLLLLVNLGLVAFGLGAAWARLGWAGLALLLMNLSYNASNAIARNSGGRYLLPVDWMIYAYAALGLLEITITVSLLLGASPARLLPLLSRCEDTPAQITWPGRSERRAMAAAALLFVLVGSLPVLAEQVFPRRYPLRPAASITADLLSTPALRESGVDLAALKRLADQPQTRLIQGRALYPRFYAAGDGEPRTAKTGYEPLDFARTLFLVVSNDYNGLVMLRSASVPAYLPNIADVTVLACPGSGYLDAQVVLVAGDPAVPYLADQVIPELCPPLKQR